MACVYILVGPPGSGKSYWAREKAEEPLTVIVNRDSLREMVAGSYDNYDFTILEKRIKRFASHIAVDYALDGYNVIIDETNMDREHRAHWERLIRCSCELANKPIPEFVAVWFKADTDTCIERRSKERKYTRDTDTDWGNVIRGMVNAFEPIDEPYFSEVVEVGG